LGDLKNVFEDFSGLRSVGNVTCVRGCSAAELYDLFCCFLCCVSVQIDDADGGTVLGEAECDGVADTAGSSCYECHFLIKTKNTHCVAPLRGPQKVRNGRFNVVFGMDILCQS